MELEALDIGSEVLRLMTGPVDDLAHELRCLTDGSIQVVVVDYYVRGLLFRLSDGLQPDEVVHSLLRAKRETFGYRVSRHKDAGRQAIYYAIVMVGSEHYTRPWIIYTDYSGGLQGKTRTFIEHRPSDNSYMIGYKGTQFCEPGIVYAPYLPLMR